jgi:hypothetical protein
MVTCDGVVVNWRQVQHGLAWCFLLVAFVPSVALGDYEEDKKKYDDCVAKVKRDYPLPPASINALKQLIVSLCGAAPTPPATAKK